MPSKNRTYKTATAEEYAALYSRVEAHFSIDEMTRDNLLEWLNNSSLADALALTGELDSKIKEAETIEELRDIRDDARTLPVHKAEIMRRIGERAEEIKIEEAEELIAVVMVTLESFAEERGIILTETTKGGIYWKWGRYHKPAIVIFKSGKIFAWRYLTEEEIKDNE